MKKIVIALTAPFRPAWTPEMMVKELAEGMMQAIDESGCQAWTAVFSSAWLPHLETQYLHDFRSTVPLSLLQRVLQMHAVKGYRIEPSILYCAALEEVVDVKG